MYAQNNYPGAVESVEKVTGKKIKTAVILRSPLPIFDPLTAQFKRQLPDISTKEMKTATFEEWCLALQLASKENTDLLVIHLPYGVSYDGEPSGPEHWPKFTEALEKLNKKIPSIGGSMKNSHFPLLLSFGNTPSGLGKQTAALIFKYIKYGKSLEEIGFEAPTFSDLELNVAEFDRLGLEIPEDMYLYATLINNKNNEMLTYNNRIHDIDLAIADLLKKRQEVSIEIAQYRAKKGSTVLKREEKEALLLRKIKLGTDLGLSEDFTKEVFGLLMEHSSLIQMEVVHERGGHLVKKAETDENIEKSDLDISLGQAFFQRIRSFFTSIFDFFR